MIFVVEYYYKPSKRFEYEKVINSYNRSDADDPEFGTRRTLG